MPINVKTKCPEHGLDPPVFKIGDSKFCGSCVERFFDAYGVHRIEMETNEFEYMETSSAQTCSWCGHSWYGVGAACPQCGKVDPDAVKVEEQ